MNLEILLMSYEQFNFYEIWSIFFSGWVACWAGGWAIGWVVIKSVLGFSFFLKC